MGLLMRYVMFCAALLIGATVGLAKTWHVPSEIPTIALAVDSAATGDTIALANGTYSGSDHTGITIHGKRLIIRSESGDPTQCTIKGGNPAYYVFACEWETSSLRLMGLTLRNAVCVLQCYSSSAGLENCIVRSCSGRVMRADWYSTVGAHDCTFRGNTGGITDLVWSSFSYISDCLFVNNSASKGGVIYCGDRSETQITRCTFVGNSSSVGGVFAAEEWGVVRATKCIITQTYGEPAYCNYGRVTANCCDVYGNYDGDYVGCLEGMNNIDGNFSQDPMLCDPQAGNYSLYDTSPCAPGNHPYGHNCETIGAFPVGCWENATEPTTWGKIKAEFGE